MDTAWDDDEIVAYAIGGLSDEDRRRVEARAREDSTLDATLAVMGALRALSQRSQRQVL